LAQRWSPNIVSEGKDKTIKKKKKKKNTAKEKREEGNNNSPKKSILNQSVVS